MGRNAVDRRVSVLLVGAVFSCILLLRTPAQAAEPVSACTPEMLDVEVLPPLGPNSVNELHGLVIEVRNRSHAGCQLQGPVVELRPMSGADGFTNSFFSDQEMSPSERQFDQRHSELAPGETAHLLIAWHSLDSPPFPGCLNRDSLALSSAFDAPPFLTVEHLWMRICDRAFVSRYRAGRFTGEPIAEKWLQRFEAKRPDFSSLAFAGAQTSLEPPVVLEADIDRKMLHDYFALSLDLPQPNPDCPFVVLRKREADGLTKVYMNQCHDMASAPGDRLRLQNSRTTWVPVPALGMQPERTGVVEYVVFSRILEDGYPVYARSAKSVTVRDPMFPALPDIDSPFPACQPSQLQSTALPTIEGGSWHDAHVYDFTNISEQTCAVGGVPRLTFSHPEGKSYSWIPSPCPNCSDPLFEPRPNGWIDLKPRESAHFIVGATRFNTETGRWRGICSVVDSLDLSLIEEQPPMTLPFGVGTCAQVTISAWRQGKYDGDPRNLAYGKSATTNPASTATRDCARPDSGKLSTPVIMNQGDGMTFALSASSEGIPYGAPVLLHLYIDNQTDHEASVMTCQTLGFFWSDGFDVYDADGHRLLKKKDRQNHGLPGANAPNQDCLGLRICGRNFGIPIPPHSCTTQDSYDFTQNLGDSYDLPPGIYAIVPARPRDANMCRATVPRLDPAALADKLKITIEQN